MNCPFRALPQAPASLPKDWPVSVVASVSVPARRGQLGVLAVLAATPAAAMAVQNPDAELIRLCAEHPARLHAVNYGPEEGDGGAIWQAYERSRVAISSAVPVTMAGLVAKAQAAKAEALNMDGSESPRSCAAETWAWDLVNDLLRLEGGAPAASPAPVSTPAPSPDAEVVRLAEGVIQAEAACVAAFTLPTATPEEETACEPERERLMHDVSSQAEVLAPLPVVTLTGVLGKARAALAVADKASADGEIVARDHVEWLAYAALEDLVRVAGGEA